jgi:phosphoglycerol transferase MdoB-like AlkP superfamily enzyme
MDYFYFLFVWYSQYRKWLAKKWHRPAIVNLVFFSSIIILTILDNKGEGLDDSTKNVIFVISFPVFLLCFFAMSELRNHMKRWSEEVDRVSKIKRKI